MDTNEALDKTRRIKAQTRVELVQGMSIRRNRGGTPIVRIESSADPSRGKEWKEQERRKYTSLAEFNREVNILDDAGGGELVFADTLITYWNLIVITDPLWRPQPTWKVGGGFDHGKVNPTVLEKVYIDYDGNRYFCGEYYMPGQEIWQNAPEILKIPDLDRMEAAMADPSMFPANVEQSQGGPPKPVPERAKSLNELYEEQGVNFLSQFHGDRSDISFANRVLMHWANLDVRKPSLFIVCRNYAETPQYGLHPWDSPNLLWEMMRRRRVKLDARQLMNRNPAEALVDKDNHGMDACKYFEMSLPEPAVKTKEERAAEAVKGLDATSAMIRYQQFMEKESGKQKPPSLGRRSLMQSRRFR